MSPSLQGCCHPTSPHTDAQWGFLVHVFSAIWEKIIIYAFLHKTTTLTCETFLDSSLFKRSPKPANKLPPPVSTTLPSRTWRRSGSQALSDSLISRGMLLGRLGLLAWVRSSHKFLQKMVVRVHSPLILVCERRIALPLRIFLGQNSYCSLLGIHIV